jgi:DNA-binding transcriptional LysR family regulator
VREHPFVDVRIAEAYSGTLTDWVVSGQLDVAIVTEPQGILDWSPLASSATGWCW